MNAPLEVRIDPLLPQEMAVKAELVGCTKANLPAITTILLGILAGAFIALGAMFATTVGTGLSEVPFGINKLLVGLAFSLGLILVIIGGAELFTGNNLIIMAFISGKVSLRQLLRNWTLVYLGNFIGSVATALLVFFSKQYTFGGGSVGLNMLTIGNSKAGIDFIPGVALGILCNALVCLAVWLTYSARSTTDKILAIIPPITAFVAAGFEHSVANMYFIPMAMFVKQWAGAEFFTQIGLRAADFGNLTWENFFIANLIPVTIGNIIGGSLLVGVVYWLIYLRRAKS